MGYKNKYYRLQVVKTAEKLFNNQVAPFYLDHKTTLLFRLRRLWLKLTGRFTGHIVVNTKG